MGVDSYDIFLKNLGTDDDRSTTAKPSVYKAEMEIAAKLMDWKAKWHPHGKGQAKGSVVDGLGMAIHTWGGGGHSSTCTLKIHPDGGVETLLRQPGPRHRHAHGASRMVLAETFGLPLEAMKVNIGSSKYPASGPSGGSTTVGGVCESHRRAGQDAFAKIAELVAQEAGGRAGDAGSRRTAAFRSTATPSKSMTWKEACSLLGMKPLEVKGEFARGTTAARSPARRSAACRWPRSRSIRRPASSR